MKRWFQFIFLACFVCAASAFGQAKTQTRLLLTAETARPGDTIWAGIEMKMEPLWHTYWRNGGDSGIPTKVEWTLPKGIGVGEIQWPVPEKLISKAGDSSLVTYVYQDEVILLVPLILTKDLVVGPLELKGKLSWQECAELCVQGHSDISATLTIGSEQKTSADAALIAAWQKKLPRTDAALPAKAFWDKGGDAESRPVIFEWQTKAAPADFFPYGSDKFEVQGATDNLPGDAGAIHFRKLIKKTEGDWPKSVTGILVAKPNSPEAAAFEVTLPIGAPPVASAAPIDFAALLKMLLFAFVGGLILNIMPCVLPVISLKILSFVKQSEASPQRVRRQGMIYGLGVLTSFLVLAALAIAAEKAGRLAGWGSEFRNPHFRVVITVLMFLISLNLFGVFEVTLSGRAMGAAGDLASKGGALGAFFNGVLATILATPCTAPFLGAALAFAFTQPPLITCSLFLSAGFGLALPFVVLCWEPRLLGFLPKPGAWMEKFKIAMGFPMLGSAYFSSRSRWPRGSGANLCSAARGAKASRCWPARCWSWAVTWCCCPAVTASNGNRGVRKRWKKRAAKVIRCWLISRPRVVSIVS